MSGFDALVVRVRPRIERAEDELVGGEDDAFLCMLVLGMRYCTVSIMLVNVSFFMASRGNEVQITGGGVVIFFVQAAPGCRNAFRCSQAPRRGCVHHHVHKVLARAADMAPRVCTPPRLRRGQHKRIQQVDDAHVLHRP